MTDTQVVNIILQMLIVVAKVTAPILVTSLAVGLLVALFQSVTQIQEMTLTFVPKVAAVAVVLVISGHWMIGQLLTFTTQLFNMIPQLVNGG